MAAGQRPARSLSSLGAPSPLTNVVVPLRPALVYVGMAALAGCTVLRGPPHRAGQHVRVHQPDCMSAEAAVVLRAAHCALWVFVLRRCFILLTVSGRWFHTNAAPVMPALQSHWLPIHVSVVSLGSGYSLVWGAASILFLLKMSRFGEPEQGRLARMVQRISPDARVDAGSNAYRTRDSPSRIFGLG